MFRMPKLVPAALLVAHLGCWAVGATTAAATAGSIIDGATAPAVVHVWEPVEVTLAASSAYANPYTDCEIWAELTGPGGFGTKRVYGFWDGNHTFKIRMVAPAAGFYSSPDLGLNQIRIAYVLKKSDLINSVKILKEALKVYTEQ